MKKLENSESDELETEIIKSWDELTDDAGMTDMGKRFLAIHHAQTLFLEMLQARGVPKAPAGRMLEVAFRQGLITKAERTKCRELFKVRNNASHERRLATPTRAREVVSLLYEMTLKVEATQAVGAPQRPRRDDNSPTHSTSQPDVCSSEALAPNQPVLARGTRVYEHARMLGLPNKELIGLIRSLGIGVDNHMSRIDLEDWDRIKKAITRQRVEPAANRLFGNVVRRVRTAAYNATEPEQMPQLAAKENGRLSRQIPLGRETHAEPEPSLASGLRVYELARQLGFSNKELISKIRALGLEVASHMTPLPAGDIPRIKRSIDKERAASTVTTHLHSMVLRRRTPPTSGSGGRSRGT